MDWPQDRPPLVSQGHSDGPGHAAYDAFRLPDRQGRSVWTYFNYFATAYELEQAALEMPQACHAVSEEGILSPEAFLPGGRQLLESLPDLDRTLLHRQIDAAHSRPPVVDLTALEQSLGTLRKALGQQQVHLDFLLAGDDQEEALRTALPQALLLAVAKRKLPQPPSPDEIPAVLRFLRTRRDGGPMMLLCSNEEYERHALDAWRERYGLNVRICSLTPLTRINAAMSVFRSVDSQIDFMDVLTKVQSTDIACITREAMAETPLLWRLLDPSRLLVVEDMPKTLLALLSPNGEADHPAP
jgi:hypothetical protein